MVSLWKQSDTRWGAVHIGKSELTFGKSGCLITSLACMTDMTPLEVNKLLMSVDGYDDGNGIPDKNYSDDYLVIHDRAAKVFGLLYHGKSTNGVPNYMTIACTNFYARKGYPTHFFLWLNDKGLIIDPLNGQKFINKYNITSYRLYEQIKKKDERPV